MEWPAVLARGCLTHLFSICAPDRTLYRSIAWPSVSRCGRQRERRSATGARAKTGPCCGLPITVPGSTLALDQRPQRLISLDTYFRRDVPPISTTMLRTLPECNSQPLHSLDAGDLSARLQATPPPRTRDETPHELQCRQSLLRDKGTPCDSKSCAVFWVASANGKPTYQAQLTHWKEFQSLRQKRQKGLSRDSLDRADRLWRRNLNARRRAYELQACSVSLRQSLPEQPSVEIWIEYEDYLLSVHERGTSSPHNAVEHQLDTMARALRTCGSQAFVRDVLPWAEKVLQSRLQHASKRSGVHRITPRAKLNRR